MYASIQIPKPTDEQVLERGPVELFKKILSDPNTSTYGTRGNEQQGVDIVGKRNGDPEQYVGIQCKLKKEDRVLTEKIVRDEVFEALKFVPELKEYFIITTASDSASIQRFARELEVTIKKDYNRLLSIQVWGWDTLQREIQKYPDVTKIFLPDYTPHSDVIHQEIARVAAGQHELSAKIAERFDAFEARIETSVTAFPNVLDTTGPADGLENHIDKEIDAYREIAISGRPIDALSLLNSLYERLPESASGRIQFRLKANIASCLFGVAREEEAISLLIEAHNHAPDDPKAKSNLAMAYLMEGNWEKAVEICEQGLAVDPANHDLAGYLIQARKFDADILDPFKGIPGDIRHCKAVQIGHLFYLRQREMTPDWWDLAIELFSRFPEEEFVIQAAAESTLDRILTDHRIVSRHQVAQSDIEELNKAKGHLAGLWTSFVKSQKSLRGEYIGLATNLVLCCDLLGDVETMERLLSEYGEELLVDDAFAIRVAQMSFNYNKRNLFERALKHIKSTQPKFHFDFYHALETKNWKKILKLAPSIEGLAEEHEKELFGVAASVAKNMTFKGHVTADDFLRIRNKIETDFRGYVLLLNAMDDKEFSSDANEIFDEAIAKIVDGGGAAARAMFAHYAYKRREWHVICQALDGYVDTAKDNAELRLLATAYANAAPATRSAVRFFKDLGAEVKSDRYYIEREAVLHFNRGALRQSEDCYRRAIVASESTELGFFVPLLSVLLRAQKHEEIKAVIADLIQTDPIGEPEEFVALAQVLMSHGHPERAMSMAYKAISEGQNSAEVHSAFCILILMNTRQGASGKVIPNVTTVQTDAWVRLEKQNGESFDFVISDAESEPRHLFSRIFSPNHPFVAQCANQSVGFEFQVPNSFNAEPISWKIAEIQHKFGHACRLIMNEFSERFPESRLMGSVQTIGDDVQPFLNFIKDRSQRIRSQANLYTDQGVPISIVAALFRSSSIQFAHNVRCEGLSIATCHGNNAERDDALTLIAAKREQGVVIDAYTAWTAATLGAFDTIKKVFGEIRIPQSCFDEITKLIIEAESNDSSTFSIHWKDGQFFRDEQTEEQIEEQISILKELHAKISYNCKIVPSEAPDEISDFSRELIKNFASDLLDPAFCSATGGILLSEDMQYRTLANQEFGCEGVWLQAAFMYAAGNEILPIEDYCKFIVGLAHRKHAHLSITGAILAKVAVSVDDFGKDDLAAVAEFIGNETADIPSHFGAASDAIRLVWSNSQISRTAKKNACSVILRSLLRFRKHDWSHILAALFVNSPPSLRDFIATWSNGHFLPQKDFTDAVATALKVRFSLDEAE